MKEYKMQSFFEILGSIFLIICLTFNLTACQKKKKNK